MTTEPQSKRRETATGPLRLDPGTAERILEAIASLEYGAVEVTVHNGRVVQIDRRERVRLSSA